MIKTTFTDVEYDDSSEDLKTNAGDLTPFINSHETLFDQLLKDAFESSWDSMRYIFAAVGGAWGFEGRNADYTATDNLAKQEAYMYLEEILNPLSFLFVEMPILTPTFTATGFTIRVETTLSDVQRTSYDKTLTWNQTTKRATVT